MVNGIDYGFTEEVTKIDVSRIRERLDSDSIVVISNMGFSSSGDVLNCKYIFLIIFMFFRMIVQCIHQNCVVVCLLPSQAQYHMNANNFRKTCSFAYIAATILNKIDLCCLQ